MNSFIKFFKVYKQNERRRFILDFTDSVIKESPNRQSLNHRIDKPFLIIFVLLYEDSTLAHKV